MIEFYFNEQENIIYVTRKGEIYTEDILQIIEQIHHSFSNKKHLYILQNTTKSVMKYQLSDLKVMIDKFKEKLEDYVSIKIANYTEDPGETAAALVFEEMAGKINKLHHKTFSTEEFAKYWLQKGMVKD